MNLLKIIDRSKNKDNTAFQVLFELFYDDVYKVSYLITRNQSLAEDATQETFLKALKKLKTLKEPRKFGSWIKVIASNSALDILRKQKRFVTVEEISEFPAEDNPNFSSNLTFPEAEVERLEIRAKLLEEINALKPIYRQVIVLRFFVDLNYDEISEALNVAEGTVKSRLHRALKILNFKLINRKDFPLTQKDNDKI